MQQRLIDIAATSPWLESLPSQASHELLSAMVVKNVRENQVIQRKGDDADGLYGVLEGRMYASSTTINGNELIFTPLLPGDWFGEISVLDHGLKTHDVTATRDSVLAIIPKSSLHSLCQRNHHVYSALVTLLCSHCRQAFNVIDDFMSYTPEQRLAKRLLEFFARRGYPQQLTITQSELSSLVGLSRQTINKTLKKWEHSGWIKRQYSAISILNKESLMQLTEL